MEKVAGRGKANKTSRWLGLFLLVASVTIFLVVPIRASDSISESVYPAEVSSKNVENDQLQDVPLLEDKEKRKSQDTSLEKEKKKCCIIL